MSYEVKQLINILEAKGEVIFKVKAKPGAPKDTIIGEMADGTLKIAVSAAPVKGKANERLISFLAGEFGVKRQNVNIIFGQTAKIKLVKIII